MGPDYAVCETCNRAFPLDSTDNGRWNPESCDHCGTQFCSLDCEWPFPKFTPIAGMNRSDECQRCTEDPERAHVSDSDMLNHLIKRYSLNRDTVQWETITAQLADCRARDQLETRQ